MRTSNPSALLTPAHAVMLVCAQHRNVLNATQAGWPAAARHSRSSFEHPWDTGTHGLILYDFSQPGKTASGAPVKARLPVSGCPLLPEDHYLQQSSNISNHDWHSEGDNSAAHSSSISSNQNALTRPSNASSHAGGNNSQQGQALGFPGGDESALNMLRSLTQVRSKLSSTLRASNEGSYEARTVFAAPADAADLYAVIYAYTQAALVASILHRLLCSAWLRMLMCSFPAAVCTV